MEKNFENENIITVNVTLLIDFNEWFNGILFEEMSNSIMSNFVKQDKSNQPNYFENLHSYAFTIVSSE